MSNNTTFAALKKNRSTQLSSLHTEIEKINNPSTNRNDDDRLWRAELDKSGNGYAVIRFLPAPEGEDRTNIMPFFSIPIVISIGLMFSKILS